YTYHYTGPDLAPGVDNMAVDSFSYSITDGKGGSASAVVHLCVDGAQTGGGFSHGSWGNNANGAENLPLDLKEDTVSFDDFFKLDDGMGLVANRTWKDSPGTQEHPSTSYEEISLAQAVNMGNGQGSGGNPPGDDTFTSPTEYTLNELGLV